MLLKCCVNGPRLLVEHPALPVSAEQIARAALDAQAAGAGAVHLHAKRPDGQDTLDAELVGEAVLAVRAACPGLPVGVTTGAWAEPDPEQRRAAILAWRELPDFASVNWHEDGANEIARVLLEQDIGVEAGLWCADSVDAWLDSPLRDKHLRVLLELPDGMTEDDVHIATDDLLDRLRRPHRPAGAPARVRHQRLAGVPLRGGAGPGQPDRTRGHPRAARRHDRAQTTRPWCTPPG